ncbi:hypothetical protein [Petroclostridium sp. X23]|uniref:hypothetical protein n=1 Tax=Petroclostridium sp. X23 TaxID=3045146 RepID=UPI0024ADA405|nr:hypothetical protein [Petroclostridium sp. X23]WHH59268.1 hypothetical protein QKW49_00420 [Petroclostridium sp. X23]
MKEDHPNNQILRYSREMSLNRKIFLVNPINDKIEVFKVYKSLFDIFKSFDLVVTAVGSKNALDYEKLKK